MIEDYYKQPPTMGKASKSSYGQKPEDEKVMYANFVKAVQKDAESQPEYQMRDKSGHPVAINASEVDPIQYPELNEYQPDPIGQECVTLGGEETPG